MPEEGSEQVKAGDQEQPPMDVDEEPVEEPIEDPEPIAEDEESSEESGNNNSK